jgi:hypothetical protein
VVAAPCARVCVRGPVWKAASVRPFNLIVSKLNMRATSETRKPVEELRPEDLETFPIWEYATDEEAALDETYVRPLFELRAIPRDAYNLSVAATFRLNSGAEHFGIVDVTTANGAVEILPGFIFVNGRVVHMPTLPEDTYIRQLLPKSIGAPIENILPAQYRVLVKIEGESVLREGVVP